MAEISKEFKILLLINIVVAFVYGVLYTFLPNVVYSLNDAPYFDNHFWRLFGGVLIGIGITTLLGLKKGDWDSMKLYVLYAIIFLIITGIINVTSTIYITRSATNMIFHWIDNIVIIVFAVIDSFFYWKEEKK
ncbi:MAG: DUF4345 family protein [Candidatus Thorarchaeota archaeon]